MHDQKRYKLLHGPYRAPRCRIGSRLFCEVRGEVIVCGISGARIPWPIGKRGRARSLVVCGDLAKAVLRESNIAICYWFGITAQTVSKWRKALDVPQVNEGTRRLYVDWKLRHLGVVNRRLLETFHERPLVWHFCHAWPSPTSPKIQQVYLATKIA